MVVIAPGYYGTHSLDGVSEESDVVPEAQVLGT